MRRFATHNRVVYWEEPVFCSELPAPILEQRVCPATDVVIVTPRLPQDMQDSSFQHALRPLLDGLLANYPGPLVRWYYTPLMLPFSRHVIAAATVYDCMDELANFRFASPALGPLESQLLAIADMVFTGGFSLFDSKKDRHPHVHLMPSSVDREHFAQARSLLAIPDDMRTIPEPRIGFFGVIDERMDLSLLEHLADVHPDWSLILIGPLAKIEESDLPRRANIHYLGPKRYEQLPSYLKGWEVAIMPFAVNDSTRFISPTKTPEYLAGGRPIVSTRIADVVHQYGEREGVFIADNANTFVAACEQALAFPRESRDWLAQIDAFLLTQSWDITYRRMADLVEKQIDARRWARPLTPWSDSYDFLVVGAGFAGSVLAERMASQCNARVLLIDRRDHIGGNAFDRQDAAGILIHQYGPHIFHTNSDAIVEYLSGFTSWRSYEHRVLASVRDQLVPVPINRNTLNQLYGLSLATDAETAAWFAQRARPASGGRNAEEVVVAAVGRELYELFFQGYTRKQWGIKPSQLDGSVTARIPARTNGDNRYFQDRHQLMPANGYTALFTAMLDHPNIDVALGVEWNEVRQLVSADHVIFTGPIDEYFGHRFGHLPYRSLRFDHQTFDRETFQAVGVINYPHSSVPYTRITEYKHLTGQKASRTSISYEYPSSKGDPYYPMPTAPAQAMYQQYRALSEATAGVTIVGRLATYRYYNMDQVVGQALATFHRLTQERVERLKHKTDRPIAI
ncbi:MAG: UDP-galactopyranose mutase [Gemmatimonadaceae bacterium]|nr:UDP-galactopyranose mutase [Gemmatimonadaceae bacterium]